MASVTGSRLAFYGPGGGNNDTNVVLVNGDGTVIAGHTVPAKFNIEVFTSTPTVAQGSDYQGSAYIQGAVRLGNNGNGVTNEVQAGSPSSVEQILSGSYTLLDQFGNENISQSGTGADTIVGSGGDTITGSSSATSSLLVDASNTNPAATAGPQTIIGGAGATTVWAARGDNITGGSGSLFVAGDQNPTGAKPVGGAGHMMIKGGAGSLTAVDLGAGNTVTGSTGSFTFIDDSYGGGGNNTITGGSGTGQTTNPQNNTYSQGTVIIGGNNDLITAGSGTTLVNALKGSGITVNGGSGAATVWAGASDSILGGSGALEVAPDQANHVTVTGQAGALYVAQGGTSDSIAGGSGSTTVIGGTGDTVTGGSGGLQFNAGTNDAVGGGSGSLNAYSLGTGNTVSGSTSTVSGVTTHIDDSYTSTQPGGGFTGGHNTLTGGAGDSTIIAGPGDVLNSGAGNFQAWFTSNLTGSETVNLGSSTAVVRDSSVTGGAGTSVTVSGFNTSVDTVASNTSVNSSNVFQGTSSSSASGTTLTFVDGTKMFIAGVTDPTKIHFTQ